MAYVSTSTVPLAVGDASLYPVFDNFHISKVDLNPTRSMLISLSLCCKLVNTHTHTHIYTRPSTLLDIIRAKVIHAANLTIFTYRFSFHVFVLMQFPWFIFSSPMQDRPYVFLILNLALFFSLQNRKTRLATLPVPGSY